MSVNIALTDVKIMEYFGVNNQVTLQFSLVKKNKGAGKNNLVLFIFI